MMLKNNMLFGQMENLQELLPGIEEFLCTTLANENLSELAEEQRQYFVERLDILQLPPSIPPRKNVPRLDSSPERTQESIERLHNSPERDVKSPIEDDCDDFAAYQRELSRSLLSGGCSEEELKVKVYDDIDHQQNNSVVVEAEINFYEIPVPKRTEPESPEKENDYEETTTTDNKEEISTSPVPPPLPPRRDRTASDNHSRSSCGSILDDVKPSLPVRPQLTPKSEICRGSTERLVDKICDELDGTSYESYDDESREAAKFNVQLPMQMKKSSKHKKLSKSRSSKEWDLHVPFKCLEEVTLSGELQYKGKLSWTRKTCALSEGRLVCYRPDKCDSKPALVIQLTGYNSTFSEKDNRKGFDIKLTHPSLELHTFSVDFKDWASLWCEYMNTMSEGRPPPGQYQHLARTPLSGLDSTQIYGSKNDIRISNSLASLTSSDGLDQDFVRSNSFCKGKVSRMGSFAFRASQFFESIGKKTGRKLSSVSSMSNIKDRLSATSSLGSPCSPATTPDTPVFLPEIPLVPVVKPATHQGYLCIYSNFNRRKWGKRWCLVRDNSFECYKNEHSTVCEIDFLLKYCKLRRAVAETKSELGLMLVEKAGEKITIEPLSKEEMCGWLKVLMNETSTEKVPPGLETYWVEEESPYHDINPGDLSSPTSEAGYSSIKDFFENALKKPPEPEIEDSAFDLTANTTLISDNQIPVSPLTETDDSKLKGEITGHLYSQVKRKSSSESPIFESQISESRVRDSVFTFSEADTSYTQNKEDNLLQNIGDNLLQTNTVEDNSSSMFADILCQINNHFTSDNSVTYEDEKQVDTAYNSAVCSENSSLERKPHQDVHSTSDNLDTLSQGTDIMVSPLEDFGPPMQIPNDIDIQKDEYENHVSAKIDFVQSNNSMQFFNQSTRTNFEFTSTIISQHSNNMIQTFNQSESMSSQWTNETNQSQLTVESKSVSRDQCDSAIFESESILEDLDASPKALLRNIEQLRTHLVELKKTRISVRNQKEQVVKDLDRIHLDEEYNRLDDECKTITDEISILEERLSLHTGYSNS